MYEWGVRRFTKINADGSDFVVPDGSSGVSAVVAIGYWLLAIGCWRISLTQHRRSSGTAPHAACRTAPHRTAPHPSGAGL